MSETPPEFDLQFLPDWLKEGSSTSKWANFEGESEGRRGGREGGYGRRDDRGGAGRPGGDRPRPRGPGGPGGPGDRRGPRPGGGGRPGERGPKGNQRFGPGGQRGGEERRPEAPRRPPAPPVEVKIEFLPEPNGATSMARQIKESGRAYPLFVAARLFLERPERHRVRISSIDPTVVLYQAGDGPIALEQEALQKAAFQSLKDQYYREETVQGEPIKGNYPNVARSRTTGIYLGPTNYHAYQPGLRRLYEERFARRMSYQDFLYKEIEILTTEQAINDWKEQARSTTTYLTTQEPEPVTFKTLAEAEQHFRAHYLGGLIRAGLSLECSGQASRQLPDRQLSNALRDAWERERGFPVQMVNALRAYMQEAGLHFFKHRKRILFVSAVRPLRLVSNQPLSNGVASIMNTLENSPHINRRDLAVKILGEQFEAPEAAEQKEALARDLLYLLGSGQVIEFHDGSLELPLAPRPPKPVKESKGAPTRGAQAAAGATEAPVEGSPVEGSPEAAAGEGAEAGEDSGEEMEALAELLPEGTEFEEASPELTEPGDPAAFEADPAEMEEAGQVGSAAEGAVPEGEAGETPAAPEEPAQEEPSVLAPNSEGDDTSSPTPSTSQEEFPGAVMPSAPEAPKIPPQAES